MAWGTLLRWTSVAPVDGLNYRFALHAHSHLALLGWVTMGFITLLAKRFLHDGRRRSFVFLFLVQQLSLLVMLFSYPLQGYGPVSIVASTLFVFGTYLFCWWLYKDTRGEDRVVRPLVRSAAVFLAVSSIGPYVVGFLKAKGLEGSPHYYNALYFYLHFLYNGFFVSGLLSLVFSDLKGLLASRIPRFEAAVFLVGTSVSYFLSVLWTGPDPVFYALGAGSAALQLSVFGRWVWLMESSTGARLPMVARLAIWLLLAKFSMQLASSLPEVARWLFASQSYTIIGYIHFVMLGILTPFLFVGLFPAALRGRLGKSGCWLYGCGFLSTEFLLFGAGLWAGLRSSIPFGASLLACYAVLICGGSLAAMSAIVQRKDEVTYSK